MSDCDGYTSSSILWLYIKQAFPKTKLNFILHDHKEHGLNDKIDWIEDNNNFDLVICPDSASYDVEEHGRLNELGIDCIVLDHHAQLYDKNGNPIVSTYPNTIVVNNQLSEFYPNKSLCGAGMVYKFCEVLDDILGVCNSMYYIDLAALGEIADVMDKTNIETNYIMQTGLKNIRNKGFRTLIESQSYSLKEKAQYPYPGLTTTDIAFYIAPMINAITRVGSVSDKEALFYAFIEPDKLLQSTKRGAKGNDYETACEQAARVGKNAKARQDKIKEKALDLLDFKIQKEELDKNNIILVEITDEDDIPQEMTGLIAMNIVTKYGKPCLLGRVNKEGQFQGSARNDANFAGLPSLKDFLEDSKIMNYVAGHKNAFGHGINANKITSLINYCNDHLNSSDFETCYLVDYDLNAEDSNIDLLLALVAHPEYFGNQIDEIKVIIHNINLDNVMLMGANKDSVKISCNGVDYVHFKDTDFIQELIDNKLSTLTVYGRLNLNNWMERKSIQCFIDDYEFVSSMQADKYDF